MDFSTIFDFVSFEKIKKYSIFFKLLGIIFLSFASAYIVSTEIVAPLIKIEKTVTSSPGARSTKLQTKKSKEYYDIISTRNIFDSTDKPVPGGSGNLSSSDTSDGLDLTGPSVPTNLPITLIGTMVLNNPKWSLAVISGGGRKDSNVYRVDDIIRSSAVVVQILRNKVVFKNNGRLEHIEIEDRAVSFVPEQSAQGVNVKEVSDGKYAISRRELDAAFSDLSTILTQARVVPHFENGKTVGFRIFSIVPGSIYEKLGLNNHDIISRVNGMLIDDPTKGLQMFNSLKSESKIDLDIIRGGSKESLTYDISK